MTFRRIKKVAISVALIALTALCIIHQNYISLAIYESLSRCIARVIPSLFAMSVLSNIIQKCGIFAKIFSVTKLDTNALNCLIIGNLGGYPIGAKSVSDLVTEGLLNKKNAESILCHSFSCGPSFAIGVSYAIYGNSVCGFAAFASILISNIILFIFYSIRNKKASVTLVEFAEFSTKLVVDAVSNSANAMISITAMIAAFSVITSLLECVLPQVFVSFIPAIFEISKVIELRYIPLPLMTAILAFGGLCVHMQIVTIIDSRLCPKQFYISRLIQIPLATLLSAIIDYFFKLSNAVLTSTPKVYISQSHSIVPLVCMLAMLSIVLLTKIKQRTV